MTKKRVRVFLLIILFFILFSIRQIHAGLNASYFIVNDEKRICGLAYEMINHDEYVKILPKGWRILADRSYGMDKYDSIYLQGDYSYIPENSYCVRMGYKSLTPSEINKILSNDQHKRLLMKNALIIYFLLGTISIYMLAKQYLYRKGLIKSEKINIVVPVAFFVGVIIILILAILILAAYVNLIG